MSTTYSATTSVATQVEAGGSAANECFALFAGLVAAGLGVAADAIASLFDFSLPAYSAESLLEQVGFSTRQLAARHLEVLRHQFASAPLSDLRSLAQTHALLQSIQHQPLVRLGIERLRGEEWTTAQRLLANAQQQLRARQLTEAAKSAQEAQRLLRAGLSTVGNLLRSAQHQSIVTVAAESLQAMGYTVQTAHASHASGRWTALWATKGGRAMAVLVSPESNLTVDMLGWEGTSCQEELHAFRQEMEKRGVRFREEKRHLHRRREGGAVIQQAARIARSQQLSYPQALLHAVAEQRRATGRATVNSIRQVLPFLQTRQKEG